MVFTVPKSNEVFWNVQRSSAEQLTCSAQHTDTRPASTDSPKGLFGPCWVSSERTKDSARSIWLCSLYTATWQGGDPSLAGAFLSVILESEPGEDAGSFVFCKLPLGYVGRQPELKSIAPCRVHMVPHAPWETAYGHQKAQLAWRSKIFPRDFRWHTSIRSPEGEGAGIFVSQTEQQTSLIQLRVENRKHSHQCWVSEQAQERGDHCLVLLSLLQRDLSPHILLCYPSQASFSTEKREKENRVRVRNQGRENYFLA